MLDVAFFSEAGKKVLNQDSVLTVTCDNGTQLLAIADGMGGKPGGEVASSTSLDTVEKTFLSEPSISMSELFSRVQNRISEESLKKPEFEKMATTLTVCIIEKGIARIGHVGDSRLYHLRDEGIISKTKDQTEVQKLIDDRILSKARAKKYHRKNVLLSVMSGYTEYDLQETSFDILIGDRIILLTDGAYALASKKEIRDLSQHSENSKDLLVGLKKQIESRKIIDDYSAIVAEAS